MESMLENDIERFEERSIVYQSEVEAYLQSLGLELLSIDVNNVFSMQIQLQFMLCSGYRFHVTIDVETNFSIENSNWRLTDLCTFNRRYGTLDEMILKWKRML